MTSHDTPRWSMWTLLFVGIVCFFAASQIACDPGELPGDGGNPDSVGDGGVVKNCGISAVELTAEDNKKIFGLSPLPAVPANPSNKHADDPKAAHLGQFLFYDKRLSRNASGGGDVSCSTCHNPDMGWSDERKLSKGVADLTRHSPTLWNVAYQRWFFWDGRADSIWSQALKPMEDSKEMASNRFRIFVLFAKEDDKLKTAYEAIFGALPVDLADKYKFQNARPMPDDTDNEMHKNWESMSEEDREKINRFYSNLGKSFEAYQRKIISRDAPFDEFVSAYKKCDSNGVKVISDSALRGLKIFLKEDSCISCHDGPNFSDNEFHNIGLPAVPGGSLDSGRLGGLDVVIKDIFNGIGPFSDAKKDDEYNDKINFLRTDNPNSAGEFKTPTLRHAEKTFPYMHDGRFAELKDVVKFYSHFELKDTANCIKDAKATHVPPKTDPNAKVQPRSCKLPDAAFGLREETMLLLLLKDEEIEDVVNFLKTLTGKALPKSLTVQPASPILE